jgi:hypothetical protein
LATQSIYYAANIAAAGASANTVTVTFNTNAVYPDLRILEYAGAALTNPVEITAAATGTSTNSTVSLTTASAGDLIFAANLVQTITTGPGTGFTSRVITVPDGDIAEDMVAGTAGTYTVSAPVSPSGGWIMQAIGIKHM